MTSRDQRQQLKGQRHGGQSGHRGWGRLRQMPTVSKRWHASYIGPDGRRANAPATFTRKMDGEHWLAAERLLIERGEWTSPATRKALGAARGITVAKYWEQWIPQRQLSAGVRYAYELDLRKYIEPQPIGAIPVSALTPAAVRTWFAALDDSKPSAKAAVYARLRCVLNTAVEDELITKNPCSIPNATRTPPPKKKTLPTLAQLAELATGVPDELRAWVLISAWCGLRPGESTELRRGDIADMVDALRVDRNCSHVSGEPCEVREGTKNNQRRTVVIPRHIRAEVKEHLQTYVGAGDDALVFTYSARRGCPHMSDDAVRNALQPVLDRISLPDMTIYTLRHFALTMAAKSGATTAEIMARAGHQSFRASMMYQHAVSGADAALADKLSDLAEGTAS